jgi:hypothetical protein
LHVCLTSSQIWKLAKLLYRRWRKGRDMKKGSPKALWVSRYRREAVPSVDSDGSSEEITGFSNDNIELPDVPRNTSVSRDLDTYVLSPASRALITDPW